MTGPIPHRSATPCSTLPSTRAANASLATGELDDDVAPGDYVVLSVSDTGIGMPPEVLERDRAVFHHQAPRSRQRSRPQHGVRLCQAVRRDLRIDSAPGQGTRTVAPRHLAALGYQVREA